MLHLILVVFKDVLKGAEITSPPLVQDRGNYCLVVSHVFPSSYFGDQDIENWLKDTFLVRKSSIL